ncbi:hypothetical protein BYT27DRAFT_7264614 [Phlegmacium glaucopus]|nr:hypothetical protein BYT27DRAFT_7264614 [Phlegmacium glaucopus]
MPSKSAQPSKAKMGAAEQQKYNTDVVGWAKKLWGAMKDGSYAPDHQDFFDEFNRLHDTSEGSQSTKTTMLDHVAPIYDHVASQGYQPDIHYQPLKVAVSNFCTNKPVTKWVGPADQWSRSPSPTLNSPKPMPTPTNKVGKQTMPRLKPQELMACIVASNAGPSKKGKSKAPISEELLLSEDDTFFGEPETKAPLLSRASKPLPPTNGMETNSSKCKICSQRGHGCHINPRATNALAACFECNHWKLKCSLAGPRVKKQAKPAPDATTRIKKHAQPASDGPSHDKKLAELAHNDDDNMEIKVPVAKPRKTQRKAPTQPSPGQPGQYGVVSFPPDILKKLKDYESATCRQDEKIKELSQTVARLTQENRTTREWFDTRVRLLWENVNRWDEKIGAAAGDKLDALLKVPVGLPYEESIPKPSTPTPTPTPASPTPQPTTSALLPPLELSTPRADSTPINMFPMDSDMDESPKSNKRSASSVTPGQSKHHKLGES